MQTFLLACYICLQLTNLPSLDQYTILKRDNSCDQCLTGVFDQSELYSHIGNQPKQTTGGLLASNSALKQALEERLMLELSLSALKPKVLPAPKEEPVQQTLLQDQIRKTQMMIEDSIKAGEIALKTIQEKVVQDIRRKTDEMTLQLQQQQTQMAHELELQGARQREILMKEMEMMKQEMKAFSQQESKKKSEAREDFWKSYLEIVGSFLGEYKSILEGLTAQDLTEIMKEAKSILNGLTSKDYVSIMKEVFSFLSNPTSQEAKDIMKVYESFLKSPTSKDLKNMKKEPENMSEKTQKTEPKENVTNRDVLNKHVRLMPGEILVSKNGRYKLTMRAYGKAVITDRHQGDRIVKTIGPQRVTGSGPNYHLVMQSDGNLVIYTGILNGNSVNPIWHTETNSGDGSHFYLKLEDDGQLVMHNQLRGSKVWTSGKVESIQQNMHDL